MKFRKKPVVIEAVRVTPFEQRERPCGNDVEIEAFCPTARIFPGGFIIPTLEGDMHANFGDWIIKGVKGEFYPCKDEIFTATYERAE